MATPPVFAAFPPAPSRGDGAADFSQKADTFVAALPPFALKMNLAITWMFETMTATSGYKDAAAGSANTASNAAAAADQSKTAAQAAAIAAASSAGLPSLAGNARRPLAVLPNEGGASWQTQIKSLYIEPLQKASATGAYALNVGVSGFFNLTLTGNTVLSFMSLPILSATEVLLVCVRINQGATAYGLTFPSGVVWVSPGGVAPSAPAANKAIEYLLTFEGSQIFGRLGAGT